MSAEILGLDRPLGTASRLLRVGSWRIGLTGLGPALAGRLDSRWGRFLGPADQAPARLTVRVLDAGPKRWLPIERGDPYRIEATIASGRLILCSHGFAMALATEGTWRLAVSTDPEEPEERRVENAVRYLVARLAVEDGGLGLHAAGVLRGGRAYLFAGASRAGKSTAVALSAPGMSLGDDFAYVLPERGVWLAGPVPFDNRELPPAIEPEGSFPLAGIWRLHQAAVSWVERPSLSLALASLMGCVAMPWAMPDLTEAILEHARLIVEDGRYAHLHFRKDPDFWELIRDA